MADRETVLEGTRTCPLCGERFERLSRHWSGPRCEFPPLDDYQRWTVEGILLAGGTLAGNGPNKHLEVGTGHRRLAEWLADEFGWLCHSVVRIDYDDGGREPVYRVRTHAHDQLTPYRAWFDDGARRPPEGYDLPRHAAHIWYALAGGLQWHGDYDAQRVATFSAKAGAKAAWIERVLGDAGYDATRAGKRVQLRPRETDRWLAWIGGPIAGVEHKWRETHPDPSARKRRAGRQGGTAGTAGKGGRGPVRVYDKSDLRGHLQAAAEAKGEPLTTRKYETYRESVDYNAPDRKTYTDSTSGLYNSWVEACEDAGVRPGAKGQKGRFDESDCAAAIARIFRETGDWPTTLTYPDYRRQDEPAINTVYRRCGSWPEAIEAAKQLVSEE